jgi:hypothetical protein
MNRSVVAARAANRPVRISLPAHLRPVQPVVVTGPVRRTSCKPGAGSGSHGYSGPWADSANLSGSLGSVTMDKRWDRTVNS